MNTDSAKKALEFATIVRRDSDAIIVKVPGHNGRFYFVKVTERTVTCRRSKRDGGRHCPSVGSHSVCYHALAAWEKVYGPVVSWCENEASARKLENFGKHAVEVRSTQGGGPKAWAMRNGKPVSDKERNARILELAIDYISVFSKLQSRQNVTPEEHTRYRHCSQQMGILRITHGEAARLAREV